VENLQYLDIDQALEDLAHFIRMQKIWIDGAQNSGVILVGASYSATMVSWFRQRYPDLANGAWASSAPLHAQVDYPEYKEVVGRSINLVGGLPCYQRIERAFEQIGAAMDAGNYAVLEESFNLCTPLAAASQTDRWNFFNSLSGSLSGVVQSHYVGGTTIQNACAIINDPTFTNDLEAYANFITQRMSGFCLDIRHDGTIAYFSETSWDSPAAKDQCECKLSVALESDF
jgi:Serine carboxypeptidase S28